MEIKAKYDPKYMMLSDYRAINNKNILSQLLQKNFI